jgi:ABC-type transport system involved in multi-copper enzyme maturation permease subunit
VGSQLLFREIEGKTIFLILSKPIKRQEFILGKFFGFSFTIFLIVLFQAMVFLSVLLLRGIEMSELIVISLFFTFLKLELVLGLVFFLSTFMSNILTILVSLMTYVIAHGFTLLLDIFSRGESPVLLVSAKILQIIFPPLEALNTKDIIGSFSDISVQYMAFNTVYAFLYLTLVLFFTVLIFERKKFED